MNIDPSKKIINMDMLVTFVSTLIEKEIHNILDEDKKYMVKSRLTKRLIDLNCSSANDYYTYLNNNLKEEIKALVSLLTTHHTFFFREFIHFEFLIKQLGSIVANAKKSSINKIRVLSCACSRGQEVYSLAMFLNHHLKIAYPDMDFEIIGTDIDQESIEYAINGVYPIQEIKRIPQVYLNGSWLQGTGKISDFVKIKNHLKKKTTFKTANLFKMKNELGNLKFDIIFCRNVFIYFAEKEVIKATSILLEYLVPDGCLFLGVSETMKKDLFATKSIGISVYQNTTLDKNEQKSNIDNNIEIVAKNTPSKKTQPSYPSPIRVLVIDDSASVRMILSRIFENDKDFCLIGTANDGIEAHDFLQKNTVDAVTLDIHMPNMDGVQYLEKYFSSNHPKVIVVSSASREDARYAQKTLSLGASDFVEKPKMNNLQQRGEEIKSKIKMSFLGDFSKTKTDIDKKISQSMSIINPDKKARLIILPFSQLKKSAFVINSLEGVQPPVFLIFEGNSTQLEFIGESLAKFIKSKIEIGFNSIISPNKVYIGNSDDIDKLVQLYSNSLVSCAVIGQCTDLVAKKLLEFQKIQVLLEDIAYDHGKLTDICDDLFPVTSFAHIGTEYLAKGEK